MGHKQVKFSIIVLVYNTGNPIRRCLESLINLEYHDYEIIIINDGSTDLISINICEMFARKYSFIRLFNKENGGCLDSRRYGILKANGEYFTFCDSDDYVNENFYKYLHEATENPADLYILNNYINYPGTDKFYKEKKNLNTGYVESTWLYNEILQVKMDAVWDKIFKRELLLDAAEILTENINYGDDTYINIKYLSKVKRAYVYDVAAYYHIRDSITSVCATNIPITRLHEIDIVFNAGIDFYKEHVCSSQLIEAYKDVQYGCYMRTIVKLLHEEIKRNEILKKTKADMITNNIHILTASSLKGLIYRILLKYRLYKLAKFLCNK